MAISKKKLFQRTEHNFIVRSRIENLAMIVQMKSMQREWPRALWGLEQLQHSDQCKDRADDISVCGDGVAEGFAGLTPLNAGTARTGLWRRRETAG